ncbi:hypothetical protein [Streptomyces meridianus]|uniref:Uncharacterized protein n=1 Tax=Streptomyces meridianus TaxID=2938945 RepID=A0ABT0X314_9ACTN|nr:hypothetical protein [Streptomyces meridianus]MCM2576928.1 hypothetical protein [Streptomyces meridianus]
MKKPPEGSPAVTGCTHQFAAEGAVTVAAATDQHNHPMFTAFTRAGHPVVQERTSLVRAPCMPPGHR